jgi:hypothetical protein
MLSHPLRAARVQRNVVSALSIAFRTSATSSATTLTAPSTIVAGDLLVWSENSVTFGGLPTSVVPTGFTSISNNTVGTNRRIITAYKIAVSGDASSTITGMTTNNALTKMLLVFSTNGATSASVFDIGYETTNNDPAAQTITSGSGTPPLVSIGYVRTGTGTYSMTPTEDGVVSTNSDVAGSFFVYKIYNSSPADVTVDATDGGNNNTINSFYIQVS